MNNKRSLEVDILKFLAIIFMIFVHTYEAVMDTLTSSGEDVLDFIIECCGSIAAPIFMIAAGIGVAIGRNPSPKKFLKKAGLLTGVGLLVNLFEQYTCCIWDGFSDLSLMPLFATDVYFFFALMFVLFAYAFTTDNANMTIAKILVFSVAWSLIMVRGIDMSLENPIGATLGGLFVRTNEYSYFPLFNWAMYPTLGYFIGISLKNSTDKTKLYKKATISGALLIALGFVGYAAMDVDNSVINALACSEDCYYMPNIFSACTAVGVIFILAAITHFFVRKKESLPKAITWGSKNIMKIYVFQWLAIGLTTPLYTEQSTWFVFIAAFVVTGLAAILTALWNMALANDEALRQM